MELPRESLSGPVFNGLRGGSKIRGGIDTDIAKSCLQKAIRRGDERLACMMAIRLNEFFEIGKPVRSNMINRLPVIAGEDVGMGNIWAVMKVSKKVDEIRDQSEKACLKKILECVAILCRCKKSRLGSFVNAAFYQCVMTPEYHEQLEVKRPTLLEAFRKIETRKDDSEGFNGFEKDDAFLIARIRELLDTAESDDEKMCTFFYIRNLYESKNKYKISRGYPKRRMISSEPIFVVWNDLLDRCPQNKKSYLEQCYKMFLNENERHIYLVLSMLVYFFPCVEEEIDVSDIDLEKLVDDAMNLDIEIPEYAIDKHTRRGRSNGKTSVDFAVEGSIVENEAEFMYRWKVLHDIYVDFRKFKPKFVPVIYFMNVVSILRGHDISASKNIKGWEKIIDEKMSKEQREKLLSDDMPRGQVLTSNWKKYVYVPRNEYFVYKGPWNVLTSTEKERDKLRKLKFRFAVCNMMRARVLKGSVMIDDLQCLWVKYPSLACIESSEWKLNLVEDKVSGKNIYVTDRASMGILPMSYYSHDEKRMKMYLFGKLGMYRDFILLYVLCVGDTGLYNVLVGELGPLIIDIDDDTTKKEFTDVWSIFGRRPVDSVVDVLKTGVEENQDTLNEYLHNLDESLEKIVELAESFDVKFKLSEARNRVNNVKEVLIK
jgi:hypothetical protein